MGRRHRTTWLPRLPFGVQVVGRDGRIVLAVGRGPEAGLGREAATRSRPAADDVGALGVRGRVAELPRPERDALTGLPTTAAFEVAVDRELERVRRGGPTGCVALLDVDDLKQVNGAHGHAVGDRLLVELAGLLRTVLRTTDVLARVDGDEFALLLPQTSADQATETVTRLGARITRELALPDATPVTVSTGIGVLATGPTTAGTVLSAARSAAFAAKARDRGAVVVAGRGLFEELRRERRELRAAATIDERTGLLNPRSYAADVGALHLGAQQDGTTYGLVVVDIDHFHAYNRDHGQLAGHAALREVGRCIAEVAAPARTYRYGGEEFTVLVPAPATTDDVDALGRRIVEAVRALGLEHRERPDGGATVTVTAAGTLGPVGADTSRRRATSADAVLERADRGLVLGKDAGRDRYVAMHEQLA